MATALMRVPLTEGSDDFIEVEIDPWSLGDQVQLASGAGDEITKARFSLAGAMQNLLPALSTVLTTLRRAAPAPDEIGVTLGVTLGGETGIVFAKGTTEATFAVTLTWHQSPVPATPASVTPVPAQLTVS